MVVRVRFRFPAGPESDSEQGSVDREDGEQQTFHVAESTTRPTATDRSAMKRVATVAAIWCAAALAVIYACLTVIDDTDTEGE